MSNMTLSITVSLHDTKSLWPSPLQYYDGKALNSHSSLVLGSSQCLLLLELGALA